MCIYYMYLSIYLFVCVCMYASSMYVCIRDIPLTLTFICVCSVNKDLWVRIIPTSGSQSCASMDVRIHVLVDNSCI